MQFRSGARQIALVQFMTFAARSLVLPFLSLYLTSLGFTGAQIGLVLGVNAFAQLIVTPLLNHHADRAGEQRRLYYGMVTTNALATIATTLPLSKVFLGGVLMVRDLADTPSAALLAQLTITWLSKQGKSIYGRLRAWGSLGWAIMAFISGWLFAIGGYPLLFALSAVINLCMLPLLRVFPPRTVEKETLNQHSHRRGMSFYFLAISVFIFYVGAVAVNNFSMVYFKQELGADNAMVGLLSGVAALSEVPPMLLIDSVLRRLNIRIGMAVGIVGLAILWVLFSVLQGPALLIPLMAIRGTFFTLMSISLTLLIAEISDPASASTNQSVMQATIPALATLTAGPISGWLFDQIGARALFQLDAVLALCAASLILLGRRRLIAHPVLQAVRETLA